MPPFKFDDKISKYDFAFLGLESAKPQQVWDRLCFLLSMSGLLLFPNNISSGRFTENYMEIIVNNNQKIIISYENLNNFSEIETGWSYVYDFYDWRSGSLHDKETIEDYEENFVKKIIFYSSERERVSKLVKDIVAISYVRTEELSDLEVSPTYSRLKILRMLKENGIKGRVTGYNSRGIGSYTAPVIDFSKRIIRADVKPEISFDDVYNLKTTKGYTWKLLEKIIQHTST